MSRKFRLTSFIGALFVCLFIGKLATPFSASAATPAPVAATPPSCPTASQFQTFTDALKDADAQISYSASVKAELQARKSFLQATLDCENAEVAALQRQLSGIKTDDKDIANLINLLASRLAETTTYYKNERLTLETVGIRGSQDIARALHDWRSGVVAPLSANISNVQLWVKNQNLLQTAEGRLNEVGHTMSVLKLSDGTDLQGIFDDARSSFSAAKSAEDNARHTLLQIGSPDDALAQIKGCLDDLSQMYKDFFIISDTVNKILTK